MTSQRVERTWIRTGGYEWFRVKEVDKQILTKLSQRIETERLNIQTAGALIWDNKAEGFLT